MSTQYSQSPLSQNETTHHMQSKTNTFAAAGLVLAFFAPIVALILSLVALSQIKKSNEKGRGLAIAGIVFSVLMMLLSIGILLALVSTTSTGIEQKARDTERQVDIKAMHGQIEGFYTQNGFYPTLDNLNDSSFRMKKLKGLDSQALQTPSGTSSELVSAPSEDAYSYTTSPLDCDNSTDKKCLGYTLATVLESGEIFEKRDLNNTRSIEPNKN